MVMGDDSCSRGQGSNPGTVYRMDMTFFHNCLLFKLYCLFEKAKNKQKKRPGFVHFLKKTIGQHGIGCEKDGCFRHQRSCLFNTFSQLSSFRILLKAPT